MTLPLTQSNMTLNPLDSSSEEAGASCMPTRSEHWNFATATTQPFIRIINSSFTELINHEANLWFSVISSSTCLILSR